MQQLSKLKEGSSSLPRLPNLLIKAIRGFSGLDMFEAGGEYEAWRKLHDEATAAPGYIFDASKRACWACIFKVGETNDVSWAGEQQVDGKPEEPSK